MACVTVMRMLALRGQMLPAWITQGRSNAPQLQHFLRKSNPFKWYSTFPPAKENLGADKTDEEQDLFGDSTVGELSPRSDEHSLEPSSQSVGENLEPDKGDEAEVVEAEGGIKPKYMSRGKLLAAHRAREIPELREEDLDETFVRGSGPGGQAINKTSSSVSLIHRPTGIRVQCQATRSREQNRKIARKIMLEKLDQIANPGLSRQQVQQEKERQKKRQRAKKAKKKAKLRVESEPTESEEGSG